MGRLDVDLAGFPVLAADEEALEAALKKAADPLVKALKRQIHKHSRTGGLEASIKAGKPWSTKTGVKGVTVGAQGNLTDVQVGGKKYTRNKPVSAGAVLAYLQYGTHGHAGSPVIDNAVRESKDAVLTAIQQAYDDLTKSGGKQT